MTDLAQDLLSSFVIAESELNGSKNLAVVNMRKEALDRFEALGFPTTRDEEWKYTNLKPILNRDYKIMLKSESAVSFGDIKQYLLSDLDTYKLVFINGKYSSWLSESTHQNYDICTFAAALNKYPEILSKYLGKAAPSGETFIDLNTAFADDGAYISVKANQTVDKPIEIIYLTTEENGSTFSQARNLIVVEQNASSNC